MSAFHSTLSPHLIPIFLSFVTNHPIHPSLPNLPLTFTLPDRPRLAPHLHPRRRRLQTFANPKQLADPIPALQLTGPLFTFSARTGVSTEHIAYPESEPRGAEGGRYEGGRGRDGGWFGRQEHDGESAGAWS
jgi:hypothetical protein